MLKPQTGYPEKLAKTDEVRYPEVATRFPAGGLSANEKRLGRVWLELLAAQRHSLYRMFLPFVMSTGRVRSRFLRSTWERWRGGISNLGPRTNSIGTPYCIPDHQVALEGLEETHPQAKTA
jgi:hypothetical protein